MLVLCVCNQQHIEIKMRRVLLLLFFLVCVLLMCERECVDGGCVKKVYVMARKF